MEQQTNKIVAIKQFTNKLIDFNDTQLAYDGFKIKLEHLGNQGQRHSLPTPWRSAQEGCDQREQRTIVVGITSDCMCCEHFDIFMCDKHEIFKEDKIQSLVGRNIQSVKWGHKLLQKLPGVSSDLELQQKCKHVDWAAVNIELGTVDDDDSQTVQIVAFNEQNGFYPHHVYTSWKNHEDVQIV